MGGESSVGALVPTVKAEPSPDSTAAPPSLAEVDVTMGDADKDILCPICMQIIKEAFLTACGHSFCYMCLNTHLRNKSACPSCGRYLTTTNIFPNFLLEKVLLLFCLVAEKTWENKGKKLIIALLFFIYFLFILQCLRKTSASRLGKNASPFEHLRQALQQVSHQKLGIWSK